MSNKKIDLLLLYNNKNDKEVKKCIQEPEKIKYYIDLTNDSFAFVDLDNSFCVFNSINNILFLVYTSKNNSIIFYDLKHFKKISEIKPFQTDFISNYSHISDFKNKRDLIMSISRDINDIKIWNINNLECILNIKNVNEKGNLLSACFLNKNNIYYIISSNCNYIEDSECIKVYDFNGNLKDNINNSNEKTLFVDTYSDENSSTIYIISCNFNFIKSYDYNRNELYHKYYDNDNEGHLGFIISKNEGIIRLIESCIDGNIRIWDFHKGFLIKKININNYLNGICLWDENYLLVGCENTTIKLIDLKKGLIAKNFAGHEKQVITIKKINHNIYGQCLVTQGFGNDKIKLLLNEKNFL
jgi:WD40 repeat protein